MAFQTPTNSHIRIGKDADARKAVLPKPAKVGRKTLKDLTNKHQVSKNSRPSFLCRSYDHSESLGYWVSQAEAIAANFSDSDVELSDDIESETEEFSKDSMAFGMQEDDLEFPSITIPGGHEILKLLKVTQPVPELKLKEKLPELKLKGEEEFFDDSMELGSEEFSDDSTELGSEDELEHTPAKSHTSGDEEIADRFEELELAED